MQTVVASGVRSPCDAETLEDYLVRLDLIGKHRGFSYREFVSWNPASRRHRKPRRLLWPNLALTIRLAVEFRERAITDAGVSGLQVAAAYRPAGGAPNSAHKTAKALDLDRIGGDGAEYYRCAVRLWSEFGAQLGIGLGLYTAPRAVGGIRVHFDTQRRCRTWQGIGRGFGKPWGGEPLAIKLLRDMNLPDPRLAK
jgi:hypothetical protein